MEYKAFAKINLTLDVIKKRNDGYHEMDMIMVPISLHDTLHVRIAEKDCIICDHQSFPLDESNTIYQAILLMRKQFSLHQHFKVKVDKRIPMQAGLAGGSADGAAMLRAIVDLCNIEMNESSLLAIGKQIGADVPFCLVNHCARVQGIGEKVERFQMNSDFYIVLVKPKEGVSTGKAFANINFAECEHPCVDKTQQALQSGDYESFCRSLGNTLEQSAMQLNPTIKTIKETLQQEGFDAVLMSGSGSCVFAITKEETLANEVVAKLHNQYEFVYKTKIERGN